MKYGNLQKQFRVSLTIMPTSNVRPFSIALEDLWRQAEIRILTQNFRLLVRRVTLLKAKYVAKR